MISDAQLIQDTRKSLKLPRWKLAVLADVSEAAIFNLEHEKVNSHKKTRIKIYTALIKECEKIRSKFLNNLAEAHTTGNFRPTPRRPTNEQK